MTYDGTVYKTNEKHAKMYIIKPNNSRIPGASVGKRSFKTSLNSSSPKLVNIYVNQLKLKSGGNAPMTIYTNVDLDNFKVDKSGNYAARTGVCYPSNVGEYYTVVKSVSNGNVVDDVKYAVESEITREAYPEGYIKDITEDVTISDRVYTVTVQLDKLDKEGKVESGNSIRLSGAKGAE